jgi:tRNA-dihydrouridine synthase B
VASSFNLNTLEFNTPVFLAPMSGVSDWPFRTIVKKLGAQLVFSEMLASRELLEKKTESLRLSQNYNDEFPIAVQLAGCDPEIMAQAAKINEDRGASIIDINFGCPVKKIVKKYAGSALMKDINLATEIMRATVKAVSIPVTVKMRLGWDEDNINAPLLAQIAQECGIQMITVHGRTRNQFYKGKANWDLIRNVKKAVSLPLIVNGDISSPADALTALKKSNADGVMIGRGTYGNPWLIKKTQSLLENTDYSEPTSCEKLKTILEHYDLILSYYGKKKGVAIGRKHLGWYSQSSSNSKSYRQLINEQDSPSEVIRITKEFYLQEHQEGQLYH